MFIILSYIAFYACIKAKENHYKNTILYQQQGIG